MKDTLEQVLVGIKLINANLVMVNAHLSTLIQIQGFTAGDLHPKLRPGLQETLETWASQIEEIVKAMREIQP